MSKKRVLIIDDPKTCRKCPCFSIAGAYLTCEAAHREFREGSHTVIFKGDSFRPKWCPMKDLPEYKMDWTNERSYEAGWNDMLDEIGGRAG